MQTKKLGLFWLILLGGIFIFPQIARAQAATILINEVAWMGTATSANDEWLELYNATEQEIDLTGWTLTAVSGSPSITLSGKIPAQSLFLLERTDDTSVPDINADQIYSGALNNGGDKLELKDASQNLIDLLDATAGWPAGDNATKATLERTNASTWQTSTAAGGTPKTANSSAPPPPAAEPPPPPPASGGGGGGAIIPAYQTNNLLINEFVPDPIDGQEEWLELYNNTAQAIDLSGWIIEEGSGSQTKLTGVILPQNFLVINKIVGNLNNTGDLILLKAPDGQLINQLSYGNWADGNPGDNAPLARDGQAVARLSLTALSGNSSLDFTVTTQPSPSLPNQFPPLSEQEKTPVAEKIAKGSIIINELLPNPVGDDSQVEFIELKNISSTTINLTGWRLQNSDKLFFIFSTSTLPTTTLAAEQLLTIYRATSQIPLNNSGDTLKLYDEKNQLIDSVTYPEIPENSVWAKNQLTDWQNSLTPTPNAENEIKLAPQPPLLAWWFSPKQPLVGETVNFDASDSFNKAGGALSYQWSFGDGQQSGYSSPTHIFKQAKRFTITLTTINEQQLTATKKFYLSVVTAPAALASNLPAESVDDPPLVKIDQAVPAPAETILETTLEEIKNLPLGQPITVTGKVSITPGILGSQIFYLSGSSGIQIYSYKKLFPQLKLGDEVRVNGTLSESGGEKRIKTNSLSDIQIIKAGTPPVPEVLAMSELAQELVGSLITVGGQIIETTKNNWQLAEEDLELKVYLKPSANLEVKAQEGDQVKITGILSQTTAGWRLLPRFASDIVVEKVLGATELVKTNQPSTKHPFFKYFWLILLLAFIALIALINRRRASRLV